MEEDWKLNYNLLRRGDNGTDVTALIHTISPISIKSIWIRIAMTYEE